MTSLLRNFNLRSEYTNRIQRIVRGSLVRLVESQSSYQFSTNIFAQRQTHQRRWKAATRKKTVIAAWLVIAQGFLLL